ncbi:MAG: hypothetical protein Q7R93_05480 [bacterium]|nr:hypothetical protein [bacterium]
MNTNTAVASVIIALALIGGLTYYAVSTPNAFSNATSTPQTVVDAGTNTTPKTPPTQKPVVLQPRAPSIITDPAVIPTDTTAFVAGTATPNGAFTTYWYEYGTSSALGSKTVNQGLGSGFMSIRAAGYLTGLSKNTAYHFRLVGENQYGRVVGATFTFKTTDTNPPAPVGSAPKSVTLAANGISRTTANLNGNVTPNRALTNYWFEYGQTPNLGNTSALVSASDGVNAVAAGLTLSDLTPLTTYYFRLNAQNQFGTVNGSILNFKTQGPAGIPAVPTVTTRSANGIATSTATLRGTLNPNGAETSYWFEYSTDSLLGAVLMQRTSETSAGAGTNSVAIDTTISSLSRNTTYYFRLVAQNSQGTARGDRMSFRTK